MIRKLAAAILALLLCISAAPAFAGGDEPETEPTAPPSEETVEAPAEEETEEDEAPEPEPVGGPAALLWVVPETDGGYDMTAVLYSEDVIQRKLYALADEPGFRHGDPWDSSKFYTNFEGYGGNGCTAFALKVSDLLFDTLPYSHKMNNTGFDYDDLHVGDFVWKSYDGGHIVMILEKYDDHVAVVQGNMNKVVDWTRTLTRDELLRTYNTWWSRYPDHMAGDVSGDKTLNGGDAALLLQTLTGQVPPRLAVDYAAADVNGDGPITPADAAAILVMSGMKEDGLLQRQYD